MFWVAVLTGASECAYDVDHVLWILWPLPRASGVLLLGPLTRNVEIRHNEFELGPGRGLRLMWTVYFSDILDQLPRLVLYLCGQQGLMGCTVELGVLVIESLTLL